MGAVLARTTLHSVRFQRPRPSFSARAATVATRTIALQAGGEATLGPPITAWSCCGPADGTPRTSRTSPRAVRVSSSTLDDPDQWTPLGMERASSLGPLHLWDSLDHSRPPPVSHYSSSTLHPKKLVSICDGPKVHPGRLQESPERGDCPQCPGGRKPRSSRERSPRVGASN